MAVAARELAGGRGFAFAILPIAAVSALAAPLTFGLAELQLNSSLPTIPELDGAQFWPVGLQLILTGVVLACGQRLALALSAYQFATTTRRILLCGVLVLVQAPLLALSMINLALAGAYLASNGHGSIWGLLFAVPGLAGFGLHGWINILALGALRGVKGAGGHILGVFAPFILAAASLGPIVVGANGLMTQFRVLAAIIHGNTSVDPIWYLQTIAGQVASMGFAQVNAAAILAVLGAGLTLVLGARALLQARDTRVVHAFESRFTSAQSAFVRDAQAATEEFLRRGSHSTPAQLFLALWFGAVVPVLGGLTFLTFLNYDNWRARYAFARIPDAASEPDFSAFAALDAGYAPYFVVAAFVLVLLSRNAFASLFRGKVGQALFARSSGISDIIHDALVRKVARGSMGPGIAFEPKLLANSVATRWSRPMLALNFIAILGAGAVALNELSQFTIVGRDALIRHEGLFQKPRQNSYNDVQAVVLDCNMARGAARLSYSLVFGDGAGIEMIDKSPLNMRLDQYLAADKRIRANGAPIAYESWRNQSAKEAIDPQCLSAIERQYNPMIAAGAARLLHLVD
jgi:hypothetical protein